MHLDNTCFM